MGQFVGLLYNNNKLDIYNDCTVHIGKNLLKDANKVKISMIILELKSVR